MLCEDLTPSIVVSWKVDEVGKQLSGKIGLLAIETAEIDDWLAEEVVDDRVETEQGGIIT